MDRRKFLGLGAMASGMFLTSKMRFAPALAAQGAPGEIVDSLGLWPRPSAMDSARSGSVPASS